MHRCNATDPIRMRGFPTLVILLVLTASNLSAGGQDETERDVSYSFSPRAPVTELQWSFDAGG